MDEETPVNEAPRGRMGEMLDDVHLQNQLKDPNNATDEKKFQKLVEDANTPVYDNAGINNNVLEVTLELLRIKAKSGLSDKGFTEMLSYLATVFPEGNKLPKSTYEAKKITCSLGLDVVKYHACPLDSIVYTGPHKNKDKCPICGTSRYKKKDGNHDEVDEEEVSKGRPAKIVWYLPMGSLFERWFQNLKDVVRLVYHDPSEKMYDPDGEYRTDNTEAGILKHPADAAQWRTLDVEFPDFASDPRNLRLGLSTDGINPFGNMSSTNSTWPRLDAESFHGKEEHEGKPREKSGFEIYDIVKDLEVRPGKAENVKDKDGPDTSVWKTRKHWLDVPIEKVKEKWPSITPKDWASFKKESQDSDFIASQEKYIEMRKKKKHNHHLGSHGKEGKKKVWDKEDAQLAKLA
ncbi:uncharacterized protein LOC104583209 [Brachypodium distachyon]|uniref:uncharacterized protein LOC104583209 n=1 Tax=Brachypodium distachyon TaxID=15368 RepID=UPI00052FF10B|nr:uncharacterized protein LOC104583209 [Brachypodium distachyon]|eukprot:XP_010233306.1 uncharacterized protein LOC104583209 [Brachypodium distachyon]